jgi:hypothetical protein
MIRKTFNSNENNKKWIELAAQIIITRRENSYNFNKKNYKIGLNILANKFYALNLRRPLDYLNLNLVIFKQEMKIKFKPNESQWAG